jgi:CRP/FNR family cyclic AMP-dependent transcriptional regulator
VSVDVDRLRRLPLFEELDHHDLSTIAHHVGETTLEEGQILFEQGSIPYEMFVVEEGTADVTTDDEVVGRIGPGDVVGEIALLRFQRRMATVRVTSPMRAVTVSADDLQVLEEEMPEIAGQLRSIMSARERENAERPDGGVP